MASSDLREFERDSNSENSSESSHSDLDDIDFYLPNLLEAFRNEQEEAKTQEEQDKDRLANWVTRRRIPRIHVTELLHIIHRYMPFLPLDCRTLLKSMRKVITKEVVPGRYYHFGLANGLQTLLDKLKFSVDLEGVEIYLSLDGVPLTKNAKTKFIPITASLVEFFFLF